MKTRFTSFDLKIIAMGTMAIDHMAVAWIYARFMLEGKNVLVLLASITTGSTVEKAMRCVRYYGGSVAGIASIYSHLAEIDGAKVVSLFNTGDLPGYASHSPQDCPLCKQGLEVDAVVDKFGYSAL